MRGFIFFSFLLAACSSAPVPPTPQRAQDAPVEEKRAAAQTNQCLDKPERAKRWGECNVKQTLFLASAELEKCRNGNLNAKGTVSFELRIAADGSVKRAKALGGRHGKHTSCVVKVFGTLHFAPPGKEATITVPYQLEP